MHAKDGHLAQLLNSHGTESQEEVKAALMSGLEKCAARFLKGGDRCLASLLLGHSVSAVVGEMDFVITDIS